MAFKLPVFVSSTCYDLRDLRASVGSWLRNLGMDPQLSDENGFPHISGMPPYATCLAVLEQCPLVIGIIDRRYGHPFDDWGPYSQYSGCAPTHAEIRHALVKKKRVLIYVHADVWSYYDVWRKDPAAFAAPPGLEPGTLEMFRELKVRDPAPWIEKFTDVTDVLASLQNEVVNQLYWYLQDREKETTDQAAYLVKKIEEAAPEVRNKIEAGLSPELVAESERLKLRIEEIGQELERSRGASAERIAELEHEKTAIESQAVATTAQLDQARLMLARAAVRDVKWLDLVRRTMMPKQPGRVPFHNTAEVALRGYHAGSARTPVLQEVTWSKVDYKDEHGLHRGYHAAMIFRGSDFDPGVTWTSRTTGATAPPDSRPDYWRRLPNIYFGDYLEVSCNDDPLEAPLSRRHLEFQVRNPGAREDSQWVPFTYPFDFPVLIRERDDSLALGIKLLDEGRPAEAIEPLRRAMVFSGALRDVAPQPIADPGELWHRARETAALARLRFREGDVLAVTSGPHAGKGGVVAKLLLNHVHAYLITPEQGESFQASDEQVTRLPS